MGAAKRRMMVLDSQISVVLRGRGGLRRKAIWSLRPSAHSGLRQQGRRLRRRLFMARLKPCPFEGSVRITEASHG